MLAGSGTATGVCSVETEDCAVRFDPVRPGGPDPPGPLPGNEKPVCTFSPMKGLPCGKFPLACSDSNAGPPATLDVGPPAELRSADAVAVGSTEPLRAPD